MEITKARLKQIIMEEIQKFMIIEQEEATPEEEEAAGETLEDAAEEAEKDPEKAAALARQAVDTLSKGR